MSHASILLNTITNNLNTFLTDVSGVTGISTDNLFKMWNGETVIVESKMDDASSPTAVEEASPTEGGGCNYVFQKGKNPGKICGDKPQPSCDKCKKHQTLPLPQVKTIVDTAKPQVQSQIPIGKNAYGNYEHKTSNLVFTPEKFVFGKQVGDKVILLNASDLLVCARNQFKYLPEAVSKPEDSNPTDNEVEYED